MAIEHSPSLPEPLARRHWSASARLVWQALVSMRLAVHLLLFVAIASIIGTILAQQVSYHQYVAQFGPFWYRVFADLDLYDVYRCGWYIGLVAFLVLSTASCITRNTPTMLRDMALPKRLSSHKFLASRPEQAEIRAASSSGSLDQELAILRERGYRTHALAGPDGKKIILAQKGRFYRLGYIFTHFAIILFCAGALYNANLPLKIREWLGSITPLTNFALPLSKIPQKDWLPANNSAFRGIISIPVGQSVNAMFELIGDGFLVQRLPFTVHLDHFTITHYRNGIAKSFISRITLYNAHGKLLHSGIAYPNHPLTYDGVSIYQTSYNDGRSLLQFQSHSLLDPELPANSFAVRVGQKLRAGSGNYELTIEKLKVNNTIPRKDLGLAERPGHSMINVGPIVRYRVTDRKTGENWIYKSYLWPLKRHGESFLLLAYHPQRSGAEQYLAIPEGPKGGAGLFLDYLGALENAAAQGANASATVFRQTLKQVAAAHDIQLTAQERSNFLRASLIALHSLHDYPLPFLVTLHHLDLRWSAGLEMTKYPGMQIVYGACFLLVGGIFILFYVPRKRLWIRQTAAHQLRLSGDSSRNSEDFHQEFLEITEELRS
ncbi:cytochrome c biogenesis protein ResB [Acidithiobacillus sp. AMEEHan]|uniref:cytochrome c biogenesis protein ResB n=1 Tax=Acidithiobacillus sp. AMEEHan TaxID=2994951 RepID=UPI0027E54E90|nr:cytochrome c biogenesis protein ResB [Acidithiobacillus sp. AMEEHan]